jgi:hypothetical protein
MDTSVHYGQPFSMTKAAGEQHGFSNTKSMYDEVGADRNWGGKGEVGGDDIRTRDEIDTEIGELMSAAARASGYERTQIQVRLNEIKVERGLGEAFDRGTRLDDVEMAAATAHAYDKETGLLDLSKLDGDIRKRAEDDAIDDLLNSVDAGRSSGIGRAANQAAGIFSAGRGIATVANSSSSLIRSLGALINPEMVNTRTISITLCVDWSLSVRRVPSSRMKLGRSLIETSPTLWKTLTQPRGEQPGALWVIRKSRLLSSRDSTSICSTPTRG